MNRYRRMPDSALIQRFTRTLALECGTTADMLEQIAEIDRRKLYLPAGYASMFSYLVGKFHMSEDMAYKRIRAARSARRCPAILPAVADGRVHLTAVVLLGPHFTPHNVEGLLEAATHRSKREIELLIAERFPKPDVPSFIRALPTLPTPVATPVSGTVQLVPEPVAPASNSVEPACASATPPSPVSGGRMHPIAPKRFSIQATISEAGQEDVLAVQAMLAHQIPVGNTGELIEVAFRIARACLAKQKFADTERPRRTQQTPKPGSRHVPAHVRRAVWKRDGARCTFVSKGGKRCEERGMLEFDHVQEFARGGEATVAGMRLLCRAHNQHAAECTYGVQFMREKREAATEARGRALVNQRPDPQAFAP